jgi:branched-chain amino acid transport system ATP-binding protein
MRTSDALLDVRDVTVRYGHVEAVNKLSLQVATGEVVSLLGANGAGKSSLFRALSGLVGLASGSVLLEGRELPLTRAHAVTRAGLVHVPEGRRVIASLSVEENLMVAASGSRRRRGKDVASALDEVYALFPKLYERRAQPSGLMSGGEQQMLAIARGLMARPLVLLLDEPSMGLAPIVITEIFESLRHRAGTIADVAILLSEQSSSLALEISDYAYVLSRGNLVFEGSARDVTADVTMSAYLGAQAGASRAAVVDDPGL